LVPPIGAVLIVDQASRSALLNHSTNTEVPTARIWGMGPRSCGCHDRPFRSTSVLGSVTGMIVGGASYYMTAMIRSNVSAVALSKRR
jgi:hypothetical protein